MAQDISTLEQLDEAADRFIREFTAPGIFLFYGDMGLGKTTFVKMLCNKLGVTDEVSSPTFSLINEYQTAAGESIYHFDFYRLENEVEAMDIGAEEYFYSGKTCFIEWPEKVPGLIPENAVEVKLWFENGKRMISWAG